MKTMTVVIKYTGHSAKPKWIKFVMLSMSRVMRLTCKALCREMNGGAADVAGIFSVSSGSTTSSALKRCIQGCHKSLVGDVLIFAAIVIINVQHS